MRQPKILTHEDGAIYCVYAGDGTYTVRLTDEDAPKDIVTARHGKLKWTPVVVVAGQLSETIAEYEEFK